MTVSISTRMKRYETVSEHFFTPNSPVVIRIDGKTFHTFLKHANRPFDQEFMDCMVHAAVLTTSDMHGFKLAYVQSDECTFVITDYDSHETQGWFGYSVNKIVSITASTFTAHFNNLYENDVATESAYLAGKLRPAAIFDARAFVMPVEDVPNVFVWRQRDWERNSVQMLTRAHFSHKQCDGKKIPDMHEMLYSKGINWADLTDQEKNGTFIDRDGQLIQRKLTYEEIKLLIEPREGEE